MAVTTIGQGVEGAGTDTLSERAAGMLERDILAGKLLPGSRLAIAELAQHYDIGATPLREGLSRLVSRGLIVAIGQGAYAFAPAAFGLIRELSPYAAQPGAAPIFFAVATFIQVLAIGALPAALAQLGPQFEQASGHRLIIQYGATPQLIKRSKTASRSMLPFLSPT